MYSNPLEKRYASKKMIDIFSDDLKYKTWRKCWIALAESERELGLDISEEQIEEMKNNIDNIDFSEMERLERELRHDLMAGVHCFASKCKKAAPIIHLGATSCDITDNTELIQMYKALNIIKEKLVNTIFALSKFTKSNISLICLGYTHFQPAQPTTIGKRSAIWLNDLVIHLKRLDDILDGFKLKGVKGATGTQDSYLKLFDGDEDKVIKLNNLFCKKLGFDNSYDIVGQTYTRVYDCQIMGILKDISISAHKFATDFRLMQHLKMVDEPFEKNQIGSSAMAYKKNPMRSERICSLSRYVMAQSVAADNTAAVQWFERTLDDSAGRRLYISQSFMALDSILSIYTNIISEALIYKKVIQNLLDLELPFMATETVIMETVKRGGDRQEIHEIIRKYSVKAARDIKEGNTNNLLKMLADDESIPFTESELKDLIENTRFHGISERQVQIFLEEVIKPIIDKNNHLLSCNEKIRV